MDEENAPLTHYCRVNIHEHLGHRLYFLIYGETWEDTKERSIRAGIYNPESDDQEQVAIPMVDIIITRYYYKDCWWMCELYGTDVNVMIDYCKENNLHIELEGKICLTKWQSFKTAWKYRWRELKLVFFAFIYWCREWLLRFWEFITGK